MSRVFQINNAGTFAMLCFVNHTVVDSDLYDIILPGQTIEQNGLTEVLDNTNRLNPAIQILFTY